MEHVWINVYTYLVLRCTFALLQQEENIDTKCARITAEMLTL